MKTYGGIEAGGTKIERDSVAPALGNRLELLGTLGLAAVVESQFVTA